MDADQPVVQIRTMTDVVDSQVATFAAMRGLLVIFGVLALVLAAIGIYGVMSYSVAQRVREIGIRVALGAQAGQVRWLMSKQGLRLAGAGLALGLVGSVLVTRTLQSVLFGVGPSEPATMAWVSVILFAVTILATYVPAARATRVDPGTVLREE
jgi:putative ABC transport system permease protein